jgi:hypothetical protein
MAELDKDLEAGAHGTIEGSPFSNEDTLDDGHITPTEKPKDGQIWDWDDDPSNPYNWPSRLKIQQTFMISAAAFTTYSSPSPYSIIES